MSKVKFPVLNITYDKTTDNPLNFGNSTNNCQVNPSCLRSYLGFNGVGRIYPTNGNNIQAPDQCMPELMYYDIFKNYYANLQEENAYYIVPNTDIKEVSIDGQAYNPNNINTIADIGKTVEITTEGLSDPLNQIVVYVKSRSGVAKVKLEDMGSTGLTDNIAGVTIETKAYYIYKIESTIGVGGGKLSTFKPTEIDLIREKILQAATNTPYNLMASALTPIVTLGLIS